MVYFPLVHLPQRKCLTTLSLLGCIQHNIGISPAQPPTAPSTCPHKRILKYGVHSDCHQNSHSESEAGNETEAVRGVGWGRFKAGRRFRVQRCSKDQVLLDFAMVDDSASLQFDSVPRVDTRQLPSASHTPKTCDLKYRSDTVCFIHRTPRRNISGYRGQYRIRG